MDWIAEAQQVIKTQVKAIEELNCMLNANYLEVINLLNDCKGRVVVTGIGKSGLIGKKFASTLASTGTPAFFLNAAESLHGDIGVICPEDVLIAISKSGESAELNLMLPTLRKMGIKSIAITTNSESFLAKHTDYILLMNPAIQESCPFNIAPTSSTTAMLVLGDTIAITLMKMKKIKIEDYALRHPGGRIGRRFIMEVRDVMLKGHANPIIRTNNTIKQCIITMSEKQAGAISVINDNNEIIGLITDYDIRMHLQKEENIFSLSIEEIMNKEPVTVHDTDNAFSVLEMMQKRNRPINVVPVLNLHREVVGMLRLQDLVKQGL